MCVIELLVPVTLTVNVPVEAPELAVIVNGELAAVPGRGVIGDVTETVTPAGALPSHAADNVTAELNPLREVTVIVADPLPP